MYLLASCTLRPVHSVEEGRWLGHLLAEMDPWRTLHYTARALEHYVLRPDEALHRYTVVVERQICGVVCVRYPWLRGAYLELIGLGATVQGRGLGREILQWLEEQVRQEAHNVWVLVSTFNVRARAFYARQGFREVGSLQDFVQSGYDEVLLRKVLS